jgi:MFS family permease
LTPFYLEQVRQLSTERSGLMMVAYPLAIALVSPFAGALSDRIGSRLLAPLGLGLAALALFLLGLVGERTPLGVVAAILSLGGLAQALFQPANNSALLGAAPRDRQGLAGGLLATGRVLGQCASIALAGAVFAGFGGARAGQALREHPGDPALVQQFLLGYRGALWVSCGCALLGASILVRHARGASAPPASSRRGAR